MADEPTYDLVLRNGLLVDGTGTSGAPGEIALRGDTIAAFGPMGYIGAGAAKDEIDVGGNVICPGFIDVHTHDDRAVLSERDMRPKLSQGVTTVVVGNCGVSLSPLKLEGDPPPPLNLLGRREHFRFESFDAYVDAVEQARPVVNVAALVGHGSLRVGNVADLSRKATAAELDAMRARLADALDRGAIGFSTGLFYKPNRAADLDEVVALAELVADTDGVYVTHMRDEHDGVLVALEEAFETGRRARVPIVISHHKCAGSRNWGRSRETLPAIDAARRTQDVGLDAYPYVAGSTVLDPDMVDGAVRIMLTWSDPHPEAAGRDLADIAADWGTTQRDAALRLSPAGGVFFQMSEEDVRRILAYPLTMIGSDGLPHDTHPHPRLWGTFARVIGHYGRKLGLFPLERAIHKMTGLPAARFGLSGRGRIEEGARADLVIFDPDTIIDEATYEHPTRPARGIDFVVVNGAIAWRSGESTGHRNGRFIGKDRKTGG